MLKQKEYKFWFCTGSQDLYGDGACLPEAPRAVRGILPPPAPCRGEGELPAYL